MSARAERFEATVSKQVAGRYLLYLPAGYERDPSRKWPILLSLHGSGERGDDLDLVKLHGPPKRIEGGADLPFVVIAPQCPTDEQWDPDTVVALLDHVAANHRVDSTQVYLTGFSMGGLGTWATAAAYSDRFAAIAPICGPSLWCDYRGLARLPIWCFHGKWDPDVPLEQSRDMVRRVQEAGGRVRFTVYRDAEHDCWTQTYEDPALYDWLLGCQKP